MIIWILQKALAVLIAVLLTITALILGSVVVGLFNDYVFDIEGLIFLGMGFIFLWAKLAGPKSGRAVGLILNLAGLSFILIMIYGAVGMILLTGLGRHLPEAWEWPVGKNSSVIAFDSGAKVVLLRDMGRVQVYDREGRYVRGWTAENSSGHTSLSLYKNKAGSGAEEETFLVGRGLSPKYTYDLQGAALGEREWDYDSMGFPDHQAADFPEIFPVPWYKWFIASQLNSLICLLLGLSGGLILDWLYRLYFRRWGDEPFPEAWFPRPGEGPGGP